MMVLQADLPYLRHSAGAHVFSLKVSSVWTENGEPPLGQGELQGLESRPGDPAPPLGGHSRDMMGSIP